MSLCDKIEKELSKAEECLENNKYKSADSYLDNAQSKLERLKTNYLSFFNSNCISVLEENIFSLRVAVAEQGLTGELERAKTVMKENNCGKELVLNYKRASMFLMGVEKYYDKAKVCLPVSFYRVGKQVFEKLCPFYLQHIRIGLAENKHESAEHLISLLERAARHADEELPEAVSKIKKELSEIPKEKYILI